MTRSTFTAFAVPLVLAALAITVLWPARAHAQTVPVAATSYGAIATRALLDNSRLRLCCAEFVSCAPLRTSTLPLNTACAAPPTMVLCNCVQRPFGCA